MGVDIQNKEALDSFEAQYDQMTIQERRAASSLAGIYSLRMMGLFMILPVFSLYAEGLDGATPLLIGIAIGAYGLTQAALQIPFGMLSDRFGRKPIITLGLLIFAAGSVVAAMAETMEGVIFGRALQGAGAIAAAIMALTADLTREEQRVKAMAMIGMSIGTAFAISLVAGPIMAGWIGVDGLFWLTGALALGGIAVLWVRVPTPQLSRFHRDAQPLPSQFRTVLGDHQLLRLDAGIFFLHMVLTATFVAVPFVLRDQLAMAADTHWWIYLPVMLFSMALMVPFVVIAEKRRRMKQVKVGAIVGLMAAEVALIYAEGMAAAIVALLIFFIAFNVLEATMPSLVAKMAPPDIKGTAMGVYSSSQFIGAFAGGLGGGALLGLWGVGGVFFFCALILVCWLLLALTMRHPRYLNSFMVYVGPVSQEEGRRIAMEMTRITGVAEAVVIAEDGVAYLKVDGAAVDRKALLQYRAVEQ